MVYVEYLTIYIMYWLVEIGGILSYSDFLMFSFYEINFMDLLLIFIEF